MIGEKQRGKNVQIKLTDVSKAMPYILILLVTVINHILAPSSDIVAFLSFALIIPLFVYLKYDPRITFGAAVTCLVFSALGALLGYMNTASIFSTCAFWFFLDGLAILLIQIILENRNLSWDIRFLDKLIEVPNINKNTIINIFLVLIVILTLFLVYHPHFDYPLPLHVDEWFHVGMAREIMYKGYPFGFDAWTGINRSSTLEIGWHYFLSAYGKLTGDSLQAYLLIPGIFAVLAVLSTYWFAKRWGKEIGILTALLVATLPANVTIGGMTLLIPLNLFFIAMPVCLKIAFDYNEKWYPIIFGILLFLWTSHPPSAAIIAIVIGIYSLICLKEDKRKGIYLLFTNITAFVACLPNLLNILSNENPLSFGLSVTVKGIPSLFGIVPTILFLIGIYFIVNKPKKEEVVLVVSSIFFILLLVSNVITSKTIILPAQRVYLPLLAIMAIISAIGFKELFKYKWPQEYIKIVLVAFVLISVGVNIQNNLSAQYYHLITEKEYNDFLWINENTPENATFLLDPWEARPFYTITMRKVVSVMPFGPDPEIDPLNAETNQFFAKNCTNTSFLREKNVNYVYTNIPCNNNNLKMVHENLYEVNLTAEERVISIGKYTKYI